MKTILAPIDFSPASDRVCRAAVTLAKAVNARIVLLHAVVPPVMTSEYGTMNENVVELAEIADQAATKQLGRWHTKLQRQLVVVETLKVLGPPVPHILEQAVELGADYIVLGTHGHTALYELLVGSTAHGVLMKSPCPVLIVPQERPPAKKKTRKK